MSVVGLGQVVWLVIGSVIFFPLAALAAGAAGFTAAGFILLLWFLVTIVPLIWKAAKWRGMFYALTDQRILSGHGVGTKNVDAVSIRRPTGYMDVQSARIAEVEMTIPFSGRIFGYGNIVFKSSTSIQFDPWKGVKHPTDVRRFVEETLARNQDVAGQQLAYGDAVTRTVAQVTAQQRMGFLPQQAPYQASMPSTASTTMPNVAPQASLPTPQAQASPTSFCVNCGTRLTAGAKFCPECGTAISQPKDKQPEQIPA